MTNSRLVVLTPPLIRAAPLEPLYTCEGADPSSGEEDRNHTQQ